MESSVEKLITNVDALPDQIALLRQALSNSEQGKAQLESQLETLLQVFQKLDFPKLLETIDRRLETSEKKFAAAENTLREELTRRIAISIEPYIEKTVRRVIDLNENISSFETKLGSERQTLEDRFALHQETVASESDKLVGRLTKDVGKLIDGWHNAQKRVQANLDNVNNYVSRIHNDLGGLQAAQKRVEDAGNMFAQKVNFWSQKTESIEKRNSDSVETLRLEHEKSSLKIRTFGDKTTKNYKSMVFVYTVASIAVMFISTAAFWGLTYKRANSEIGAIKEFTSQERQQIGRIFEESVKNANIRNFSDEVDLRTFDFLISQMPPQLKSAFDGEIKRNIEEVKKERDAKNTHQAQVALQEAQKRSEK